MKYDGYRLLLAVGGGDARAYTRSGSTGPIGSRRFWRRLPRSTSARR
jgi:hypothetical protein